MTRRQGRAVRGAGGAGVAALCLATLLPGCTDADPVVGQPGPRGGEAGQQQGAAPADNAALLERARARGVLPVIVGVDVAFTPEGNLDRAGIAAQRRAIAETQTRVLSALGNPAGAVRYEAIPFFSLAATPAQLERLLAMPDVTSVVEDVPLAPMGN